MRPTKPPSYCPRCQSIHESSCPKQKKWQSESTKQGRGGRPWRRLRERVFNRDNFLCQIHLQQGKLVRVDLHGADAGICDHIIPLAAGGTNAENNLQTICKSCDDIKSASESRDGGA